MQKIVNHVRRDAKDMIQHESRQVARLKKLEYLREDLAGTKHVVSL
jgi:hypothetical protein